MMFKSKSHSSALAAACLALLMPAAISSAPIVTGVVVLDNQPINSSSQVLPNVMFTLDNSGSMDWTAVPDAFFSNTGQNCYANHIANPLYYNPNQVYVAPAKADGTRLPNMVYTAAQRDGFDLPKGTLDLSAHYAPVGGLSFYGSTHPNGNRGGFYMVYNDPVTPAVRGTCYANSKYTIVEVNAQTPAQQQNFANWYSYYRSRMLVMKSAAGEAFRAIGPEFRVGFHTISGQSGGSNSKSGGFLRVDTFTGAHRQAWYDMFYRQEIQGGTPLRAAMSRIGEYYKNSTSPATGTTTTDPIQYSCQPNFHILSTDGLWNGEGGSGPSASANWNNTLPNNTALLSALGSEFSTTFLPGQPWPRPYRENSSSPSTNTLADIAAYYWQTDLRPTMPNNVPANSKDPATWQHVVQYSIAFAADGTIPYPNGIDSIKNGLLEWPNPGGGGTAAAIDDMWAASAVGHGQYFNIRSADELLNKLAAALQDIGGRMASGSPAAGTSSDYESATTPYLFRSTYLPGEWTGNLEARAVNVNSGGSQGTALWSAKAKLDAKVVGSGWDGGRLIATFNNSTKTGVPFRYSNLASTQQTSLDADPILAQKVLNYIRGDRANEDNAPNTAIPAPTTGLGIFRERKSVLGAIINSAPNYQGPPSMPYVDSYNPGYSGFKAAKASRTPMIYVGSSDGMLHAFKATVGDSDSGEEKWAYIPGLTYQTGAESLGAWAWKHSDPLPKKFSHRYRVDQSPVVTDVDFGRTGGTTGSPDWRTILVAGMNKGGKGFFALDVTNPEASTEADVAGKVLWEFTGEMANDPKMGYSYGIPLVFKTRRFGWVVGVTSGYNNAAGTGHLWLLNPKTGAVLYRFDTGAGNAAVPSGLGQINGFRLSAAEDTVEQLYGADLLGNLWRFDVSSVNAGDWVQAGVKLAAISEPITTAPVISINPYNPRERWVVFASGKLLGQSDVSSVGINSTMFAIKDGSGPLPLIPTSGPLTKSALVQITPTGQAPEGPTVKGWYMEMASAGFGQINLQPIMRRGVVMWAANVPDTSNVCTNGMSGTAFFRRLGSGKNVIKGAAYVSVPDGIVGLNTAKVKRTGTTLTSSQASVTASISTGAGADIGNNAADFTTELSSGRSNIRYIQVQ